MRDISDNRDEQAFHDGNLAFDVPSTSFCRVVDSDVGTVGDQDPPLRDLIRRAPGNRAMGFDVETTCVKVRYIGVDPGNKTYTMPITRLRTSPTLMRELVDILGECGIRDDVLENDPNGEM